MSNKVLIAQNGIKITETTTYPATPSNGMMVYRSDLNGFYIYQAGSWIKLLADAIVPMVSSEINLLNDPTFLTSTAEWAITSGTGTITKQASNLNLSPNHFEMSVASTSSNAMVTTTKTIPASMVGRPYVFKGWIYSQGTLPNGILFRVNGANSYRNITAVGAYPAYRIPFCFSFTPTSTTMTIGLTIVDTGRTVELNNLQITPRDMQQSYYYQDDVNVGTAVDFGTAVHKSIFGGGSTTAIFSNAKPGDVCSWIVQNSSASTLTVNLPITVKNPALPTTVAANSYNIYTFIYDGTNYYASCVSGMV